MIYHEGMPRVGALMKIVVLGYADVGKTYFLGSSSQLKHNPGKNSFLLSPANFLLGNYIQITSDAMRDVSKVISSTVRLEGASMLLLKGIKPILGIEIVDVEGQAVQQGRNPQTAERILNEVIESDALILIVEAPQNEKNLEKAKEELAQMLRFAGEAFEKNKQLVITLVINKVDKLIPHTVSQFIKADLEHLEADLARKFGGRNYDAIDKAMNANKGAIINARLRNVLYNREMHTLCKVLYRYIENTDGTDEFSCKIFLCSSYGILNDDVERLGGNSNVLKDESIKFEPFGGPAALLWTVYAHLLSSKPIVTMHVETIEDSARNQLARRLLEDIYDLFRSGQAFFDPHGSSKDLFSLQQIGHVGSTLWGKS
jgi:GTPase SAR1 family protein